ncbi:hypothetical protein LJR069_004506 [Variovorax paradoxus]|jgi:hypothetical protein|uniref:hypothetical protein n=1 Tax=Variovorax paradoxus TaxID=34073 RepID=UPI0012372E0F
MRFIYCSYLLFLIVLAGCVGSSSPVEVRITPDAYQVGDIESPFATPVVDEVVRIKPKQVLILACPQTRPTKII